MQGLVGGVEGGGGSRDIHQNLPLLCWWLPLHYSGTRAPANCICQLTGDEDGKRLAFFRAGLLGYSGGQTGSDGNAEHTRGVGGWASSCCEAFHQDPSVKGPPAAPPPPSSITMRTTKMDGQKTRPLRFHINWRLNR